MKFIIALITFLSVSAANAQSIPSNETLNTPIGRLSLEYLAKAYAVDKIRANCSYYVKQKDDIIQGWESEDDKVFFESHVVFSLTYVQEEVLRGMDQTASRYLDDLAASRKDTTIQFFRPLNNRFISGSRRDWCINVGEPTVNNILIDFRAEPGEEKSKFTKFISAKTRFLQARQELLDLAPKGTN